MPVSLEEIDAVVAQADEQPEPAAGVSLEEIDAVVEDDEAQKDAKLQSIFGLYAEKQPERHADILDLSRRTRVRPDVVEANYDRFAQAYEMAQFQPRDWRAKNPDLWALIEEQPDLTPVTRQASWFSRALRKTWAFAKQPPLDRDASVEQEKFSPELQSELAEIDAPKTSLVRDDAKSEVVKQMGPVQRAVVLPLIGFTEGRRVEQIAEVGRDLMAADLSGGDTWALEKRLVDLQLESIPRDYGTDALEQALYETGSVTASQVAVLKGGGIGGAVGLVGGALVGGATTRSMKGARAGAKVGVKLGAKAGATLLGSFPLEYGSAYAEFREMKPDGGEPIDKQVAAGMALLYGAASAGIEGISFGGTEQALRQALHVAAKDKAFHLIARDAAKAWINRSGSEGLEEFLQKVTQDGFGYLNRALSEGQLQSADPLTTFEAAFEEASAAFTATAITGGAGAVVTTSFAALEQAQARADELAKKSTETIQHLAKVAEEPLAKASPEAVAQIIAAETAKTGEPVTSVYLELGPVLTLFQGGIEPKDVLGPDAQQLLQEAQATGQPIEVPVPTFVGVTMRHEAAAQLLPHATTRPSRETAAQKEQVEKDAEDIKKAFESENPPEVEGDAEQRLVTTLQEQLAQHPAHNPTTAAQSVLLWRALIRTAAARFQKDADTLFADFAARIGQGEFDLGKPPEQAIKEADAQRADPSFLEDDPFADEDAEPGSRAKMREAFASLPTEEKARALNLDRNTGLLNMRGFRALQPPAERPFLAEWEVEGGKTLNDSQGHPALDGALRAMAGALAQQGVKDGAKLGGSIRAWVRDDAHAQELADAMAAAVGDGIRVTFGTSPARATLEETFREAAAKHREVKDAEIAAGRLTPRGQPLAKVADLGATAGRLKAAPRVEDTPLANEQVDAFDTLAEKGEDFEAIHIDDTGLLTEDGFARAREVNPQPFVASADLRGLGPMNKAFGKKATDEILRVFKEAMAAVGGARFDLAHLHGDEFAAQGGKQETADFFEAAARAVSRLVFVQQQPDGSVLVQKGLQFAHGIAEDFDRADRVALPEHKRRQGAVAEAERIPADGWDDYREQLAAEGYAHVVQLARGDDLSDGSGEAADRRGEGQAEAVAAPVNTPEQFKAAQERIRRMRNPEKKEQAQRWIAHLSGRLEERPTDIPLAIRTWFANEFGLSDEDTSQEILAAEMGRGRTKGGFARKKTTSQEQPDELRRHAENSRASWNVGKFNQGPPGDSLEKIRSDASTAGLKLDVAESEKAITLSRIVVPEASREGGTGSAYMKRLVAYADAVGKPIALTPSTDFGGTKKRLVAFYKRFGFVENKGRKRDLSISETMIRPPAARPEKAPQVDSPEFKAWFRESKVVDADGKPLRMYHGTKRPDRIGTRFRKARATSGPMPYFTSDPEIANGYAASKDDTSFEANTDFGQIFRANVGGSLVPIREAWRRLTEEQRRTLSEKLPHVIEDPDDGSPKLNPKEFGLAGEAHWRATISRRGGDVLMAAVEIWLESGTIGPSDIPSFVDVLEQALPGVFSWEDPDPEFPSVYPVFLSIQNPLDTSAIPADVLQALERAAARQRKAPKPGPDAWSKTSVAAADWIATLKRDIKDQTSFVWTTIPDWVTRTLQTFGYDGIQDVGGKYSDIGHAVWLPFDDHQVKSAIGNRGTFDPNDADILRETASDGTVRGQINIARSGARRLYRIILGKDADLSTFLHESGHAFLDVLSALANRPDAPQQVKDDAAKALKYLGAVDFDSLTEEQQEKWARAVEAYLMEGKAPSRALESVFTAFRLWLIRIYKSIRGLNVALTDDIRGVMDRLLATDEEIQRAKGRMGIEMQMFRTPEEAGMTPAEFEAYTKLAAEASTRAERSVRLRSLQDKQRETERWWRDEEKKLQEVAQVAYPELPAARAAMFIRREQLQPDGSTQKLGETMRLDRASVEAALGEEGVQKFHVTSDGGMRPDDFATLFGYPTGADLLRAVVALPDRDTWSAQRAQEQMREKYPDIHEDRERLRREVEQALHSDLTMEMFFAELAALWKQSGQAGEVPRAAIMRAAEKLVEDRKLERLDAGSALRAERAAADKALKAAAKRDFTNAYARKREQVLNAFLYRALDKARDERDALFSLATDLRKRKARERLGKASPAYRDAVDALLESIGLKQPVADPERLPFDAAVQALHDNGQTVLFDPEPLRALIATPRKTKEITVREMRQVVAALKNLRAAAAQRNEVLVDNKRLEKDIVIKNLVEEAERNTKLRALSSSPAAETPAQRLQTGQNAAAADTLKPETMLAELGGDDINSWWYRAVVEPIQQAKRREADILKATIKPIMDAFEAMPNDVRKHLHDSVDGRKLFPTHRTDLPPPVKRFELLAMALSAGNDSSLHRLTDGRRITPEQVRGAIDLLSKEEMDWVQAVLDACESLGPAAFDLEEKLHGVRPEKVQAKAIETRHGTYRGGYFPAVYDWRRETAGERAEANDIADLFDQRFARIGTAHNFLKSRVKDFSGALSLDPGVIQVHLAKVAHDIAYREPLLSVAGLIMDPEVQTLLKNHLGPSKAREIRVWLQDIGRMRAAEGAGFIAKLLGALRSNAVISILGHKLPTAMGDLSGLAVSALDMKPRHWAESLLDYALHSKEVTEFALAKSGELRFRRDQMMRDFARQIRSITRRGPFARGPLAQYRDSAFWIFEAFDAAITTPMWVGKYRSERAAGKSDADAIREADKMLGENFVSHSPVDQAAIMRSRYLGPALMFYSYFNVLLNKTATVWHPVSRAEPGRRGRAIGRALGKTLALWTAAIALSELLSGRGPDDDEEGAEGWAQWYIRTMLLGVPRMLPFGGEVAGAVESALMGRRPSSRAAPYLTFADPLYRGIQAAIDDDKDGGEKAMAAFKAVAPLTGIPTYPIAGPLNYLLQVADGESEPENPFDFASGVVYGERENQPDNPLSLVSDAIQ